MARVVRIDRTGSPLKSPRKTSQGFLRVDGMATRAGILEYPQPDGSVRRELRPEEEVFSPRHLDSFQGAPVTDDHPPAMITPENRREYDVGTVISPGTRADGDHVAVTMDVADAKAQKALGQGKRELSPGYTVDLDETPGTHPKYGKYDAIQRNIEVNHLAIVDRARAGRGARVRMDGADVPVADGPDTCTPLKARYAPGMTDAEMLAAATAEIAREKARADALEGQLASERERADTAAGEAKALKAQLADVETTRQDADEVQTLKDKVASLEAEVAAAVKARTDAESPATRAALVAQRVDVEMAGREFLGAARFDSMSDRAVMEAVCQKIRGVKFDASDSDTVVRTTFNLLVSDARANGEANRRIREVLNANRQDRETETIETARAKRERESNEAWRKPLPNSLTAAAAREK